MYRTHFGLLEDPFGITPDTNFCISTHCYQEAFNTLSVAVRNGAGFVKITGEVGTGKTLLCRKFLASLGPEYVTAYIHNPYLEPHTLLLALADEFALLNIDLSINNQHQLLKLLSQALADINHQGKRAVLCIDEAQAMPLLSLEVLRLLTNLETEKYKLLQVVLFGQPELDEKLSQESVRQLLQRIIFQYHLTPLTADEIGYYLTHRLSIAGYQGKPLFLPGAVYELYHATLGTPRLINILAHKSLLMAYSEGYHQVTKRHVLIAVTDTPAAKKAFWYLKSKSIAGIIPPLLQRRRLVPFLSVLGFVLIAVRVGLWWLQPLPTIPTTTKETSIIVPDISMVANSNPALTLPPVPAVIPMPIPIPISPAVDDREPLPITSTTTITASVTPRTQNFQAYTLQILASSNRGLQNLQKFIRKYGDTEEFGYFYSQRQGHKQFIVYGLYPDQDEAKRMAKRITEQWLDVKVQVQTIEEIQKKMAKLIESLPQSINSSAPKMEPPPKRTVTSNAIPKNSEKIPDEVVPGQFTKSLTPSNHSEDQYETARLALQQGKTTEAKEGFERTLQMNPNHSNARLALANLALEKNEQLQAEQILREGLQLNPQSAVLAFPAARIMVESGNLQEGLTVLRNALSKAGDNPHYHAFVGALEQRVGNPSAAIEQYREALRQHPGNTTWLIGLGISLVAEKHNDEARQIFRVALNSGELNAELRSYVEKQLQQLESNATSTNQH